MKKTLVLIVAVLMIIGCSAIAEGTLYEGEITFQGVKFGVTYDEVQAAWKKAYPESSGLSMPGFVKYTRDIVDNLTLESAMRPNPQSNGKEYYVDGVYGSVNGVYNKVAGYDASQVHIYCAYPVIDGTIVREKGKAKFYAAQYEFRAHEVPVSEEMYTDLKNKLTGIYGAPYAESENVDMVWGEPDLTQAKDWFGIENIEAYNAFKKDVMGIDEYYVVWKSAVNDSYLILKRDNMNGGELSKISISYLYPQGDQWLKEAMDAEKTVTVSDTTGNTQGL